MQQFSALGMPQSSDMCWIDDLDFPLSNRPFNFISANCSSSVEPNVRPRVDLSVMPQSVLIRKVRRSIEVKGRTPVACFACKSRKKKCDNLRPCSRCVRLGRGTSCASWKENDQNLIEHPVVLSPNYLDRYSASQSFLNSSSAKHSFTLTAIKTLHSCGLRYDAVMQVFNSIPYSLLPAIMNALCPSSMHPTIQTESQTIPNSANSLENSGPREDSNLEDSRWESDETFGYYEVIYDRQNTGQWRRAGMNTRYASFHGYHKEELLARYASGEAELQRLELDALMFFLFSFKGVFSGRGAPPTEFYSRIFTGSGNSMRPLLLWVTIGSSTTPSGDTKVSVLAKPISPDEYDEAVRRTPWACIMHALGDRRSGRQLLEGFARDACRPLAALGSAEGDQAILRGMCTFCLT